MCIRALDYCPPVDITFGEFLRAIITADADVVPDDDLHYRVAFVEAFRRRGIYPRDLRTLSPDSLLWRTPDTDEIRPSQALQDALQRARSRMPASSCSPQSEGTTEPRERMFHLQRQLRRDLHAWLEAHFRDAPDGPERRAAFLGRRSGSARSKCTAPAFRAAARPRWRHRHAGAGRRARRSISIPVDPAVPGGATDDVRGRHARIVGDLRRLKIRYSRPQERHGARRAWPVSRSSPPPVSSSPRATYFDVDDGRTSRSPPCIADWSADHGQEESARKKEAEAAGRPARARASGAMYRQGLGDCFLLTFDVGARRTAHAHRLRHARRHRRPKCQAGRGRRRTFSADDRRPSARSSSPRTSTSIMCPDSGRSADEFEPHD